MGRWYTVPAFSIAFLLFAFAPPAQAQSGTGRISGLVKDSTGAVVPGVAIVATHESTGVRQETVTAESGLFLFPSLPVGAYTVRAELSGFKAVSRTGNQLTVGSDLNLTITLEPGNLSEAVVVHAESSLIQTTD